MTLTFRYVSVFLIILVSVASRESATFVFCNDTKDD